MENTTDALIMAGQILIFIIALTVCMSSFSKLRDEVTVLIGQTETIKMAQNTEGYINFIESKNSNSTRVVGSETVISSMYRAVKENYVVYIKINDTTEIESTGTVLITANTETAVLDNPSRGNITGIQPGDKLIKVTIGRKTEGINEMVNEMLSDGLYDIIKDMKFNEYLGEYQNGTEASSENRVTKRIITYVQTT